MRQHLKFFLILEAASALLAVLSFRLLEARWLAALVAGSGFTILGLWIVFKTVRWPARFKLFSFYAVRVHLWIFAFPMMIVRIKTFGRDFADLQFLGLSGPEFHRLAEWAFLALVVSTIVDLIRAPKLEGQIQ